MNTTKVKSESDPVTRLADDVTRTDEERSVFQAGHLPVTYRETGGDDRRFEVVVDTDGCVDGCWGRRGI